MHTQDLTQGNLSRHLLRLALPLIFGNLLQQFYNTIDAFVIGRYAGQQEFAAIGIAGTVMNLFLFAVFGACTGLSVLFARCYGLADQRTLRRQHFTVAGFIAEVGDITRFDSTKELQKLAGLELVADSSGKHKGKTKISKRGRKRLRYLLFEAAISVVGKNEEFKEIHRYYTTREKNPLKKMQSLIAVACKLIRVFHVILTKGISYDASKMLKDIRHPGEQLKAA